jgi:hypothetical protein
MSGMQPNSIERSSEFRVIKFVHSALHSGELVILVTGLDQEPTRVPPAGLVALPGPFARAVHIRPPLPEPPDLQEMIGAAVQITGGRAMAPRTMAQELLGTSPQRKVILAIDEAEKLSRRSLRYLAEMMELLAWDTVVLQIVFAAAPAFLDTLAEPEFVSLRNRLFRQGFDTFRTFERTETVRASHPASPWESPAGRSPFRIAELVAMGCLAAIGCAVGYAFSPIFFAGAAAPNLPSINSETLQDPPALGRSAGRTIAVAEAGHRDEARPQSRPGANPDAAMAGIVASPSRQGDGHQPEVTVDSALPAEHVDPAGIADPPTSPSDSIASASPAAPPHQNVPVTPPTIALAAPTMPPPAPAAPVDAQNQSGVAPPEGFARSDSLPTLAPVRVVLITARDDIHRARRAAEVQQALGDAGLRVAELVQADGQRSRSSVGYYFQSDREAATSVSRLLQPLLGAVNPVVLRTREGIPEPGTIEIGIP